MALLAMVIRLDNLLGALYSLPGGFISDKLGYKLALLLFNLIAMLGYVLVIAIPNWKAVIVGAILFSAYPHGFRTCNWWCFDWCIWKSSGYAPCLHCCILLAGVSLILQQVMISDERQTNTKKDLSKSYGLTLLNAPLRNLLVSDILVRFCEQIPYAFVVIWCVSINRITPLQFGILKTIEMITAMLVYIPVAYLADKSTKKPFVVTTFVFFTIFPLFLFIAKSFWIMVIAFVIRGFKEFGEPTRKALIMDLAPDGRKAATFGVYYLIRDIIVSIAAFGGALLWDASTSKFIIDNLKVGQRLLPFFKSITSPTTNFPVAFGFGLAGTLYFVFFGRDLGKAAIPVIQIQSKNK